MLQTIEELSMNAWPALQTIIHDGWILRFAKGYTRRANSVIPLYHDEKPVLEKILFCEKIYQDQDLSTIFKMTAQSHPQELDGILAQREYSLEAPTMVQTLSLDSWNAAGANEVKIVNELTHDWHSSFCQMSHIVYTDTWVDMEFFNDPAFKNLQEERISTMRPFSITSTLLKDSHALVMHDMPIHSGYEIEKAVVEKHLETILDQAENRRHVAKGIYMHLLE